MPFRLLLQFLDSRYHVLLESRHFLFESVHHFEPHPRQLRVVLLAIQRTGVSEAELLAQLFIFVCNNFYFLFETFYLVLSLLLKGGGSGFIHGQPIS